MPPSTGPVPRTATRRVLSDERRPAFFDSAVDGAPRWATGALTALQAVTLSLAALAVPAVAAFVATSADPSNADVGWTRAVVVAAGLWLLGHGVPLDVGGATVTLVPLGVTALALWTAWSSSRRSGVPSRSGTAGAVGTYALLTVLVGLVAGAGGADLLRALVGGLVVGGVGLGAGLLRRPGAPTPAALLAPVRARVGTDVLAGARAGVLAAAGLVAAGAALTAVWVVAGRATVGDVVDGLGLDAVGGAVLAVAELAVLPNLVLWCVAWLAGPGFAVGAGTVFSPAEVVAGPLPAVPLLGALPSPHVSGGLLLVAPALLPAVGALAGLAMRRAAAPARPRGVWLRLLALGGTSGLLVGALVGAASGSAGPGRMAEVGATAWLVGLLAGAGCTLGALVVAVPTDPFVRAGVRARLRPGAGAREAGPGAATTGPAPAGASPVSPAGPTAAGSV